MEDAEIKKIEKMLGELEEKADSLNNQIDLLVRKREELRGYIANLKSATSENSVDPSEFIKKASSIPVDALERKITKISTGISKLDELLSGGIRTGANVVLHGPPFSGKAILVYNFIAQSIRESVPVIVVTTDRDIKQIKYEIERITDKARNAEEQGLLKFIDVYSKGIQVDPPSKYAYVIDHISNVSTLIKAVDSISSEILKSYPYFRLLFSSLTSYIPQLERNVFLRFLQQFSQKRRAENSVSLYLLEEGIFEKSIYEAISYIMDGTIEFRVDYSRNFIKVSGLEGVKSRDWIEMYRSDTSFDLGSFTLERIR